MTTTTTHAPALTQNQTATLQYYSGNRALDCPPTAGAWCYGVFIAPDGTQWVPQEGETPNMDGTGTHYLIPAPTTTPTNPIQAALAILAAARIEADITTESERWGTFPPSLDDIQAGKEAFSFRRFN